MKTLCTKVADAVRPTDVSKDTPYRVWKLEFDLIDIDWRSLEYPAERVTDMSITPVEESEETLEIRGVSSGDTYGVEFKGPNGWLVGATTVANEPDTVEGPGPLFNSSDGFFNRFGKSSSVAATTTTNDYSSNYGSKSYSSAKTYTKTLVPGTLGLGNM